MFGVLRPTRGFLAFTPALVMVCLRADLAAGSCGEKRRAIARHRACLGRFNHRAHQNPTCDDHDGAGLVIAWDALHVRGADRAHRLLSAPRRCLRCCRANARRHP